MLLKKNQDYSPLTRHCVQPRQSFWLAFVQIVSRGDIFVESKVGIIGTCDINNDIGDLNGKISAKAWAKREISSSNVK